MTNELKALIDSVPDFPKPGILFRDISPLLRDKLTETIQAMINLNDATDLEKVDYFVGLDARGFIFAPAMAALTNKGFIMARKSGKLPEPIFSQSYQLEYGQASLDIKPGSGNVIIVDDVLATGGTLKAAAELCTKAGYTITGFNVLINLTFLNSFGWKGLKPKSVIDFAE